MKTNIVDTAAGTPSPVRSASQDGKPTGEAASGTSQGRPTGATTGCASGSCEGCKGCAAEGQDWPLPAQRPWRRSSARSADLRVAAAIAAASAYAEARAAAGAPAPAPLPGFTLPGEREAVSLARLGYVAFDPLMSAAFADALPAEVDRLIAAGLFTAPADRLVDGTPTEWLANLGLVAGNGPGSPVFTASPLLRALFAGLQELGRRYNDLRPVLLASGVPEAEAPEIAVEGMELNVNKVIPPWSGLHPHQDHHRFTAAAQRVLPGDVRHAAMRARVFTISGYARPRGPDGNPLNDAGGALTFYVRRGARSAEEKAIHDVVLAAHNTGAAFFAHTLHGVARMTRPGSVRYSFQAFFPEASAWREIAARLLGGEEARR